MFEKEGYIGQEVGAIITLGVGIGVTVLVLIFVGALGGQTYNLVESDIDAISNANIQKSVRDSIESSFEALETTGNYLPIIVLAVIITIVLSLVLGMGMMGGTGRAYGGAL